jgi:hypothetical protein
MVRRQKATDSGTDLSRSGIYTESGWKRSAQKPQVSHSAASELQDESGSFPNEMNPAIRSCGGANVNPFAVFFGKSGYAKASISRILAPDGGS